MSALPPPTIDELHERFSEARIEIAARYAEKLGLQDTAKLWCMKHHLEATSSSRYWCIAFTPEDGKQHVLARLGSILQRFDGTRISAIQLSTEGATAVERFRSDRNEQDGLALFQSSSDALSLVTTYCKAANEHAYGMANSDALPPGLWQPSRDDEAEQALRQMIAIRVKFHIKNLGAVLRDFCTYLDPETLHSIRSVGCPTATMYNWLATGERRRRQQALTAQRILVPILAHHHAAEYEVRLQNAPWPVLGAFAADPVSKAEILSAIVDQGVPLNDALAWLLKSKPATVRALGKASPYHAGTALYHINREGRYEGWYALLAGASLGNRMPRRRADWKTFIALWSAVPHMVLHRVNMATLLQGTPMDWTDPAWQQITATIQHACELFKHVGRIDDDNKLIDRQGIATRTLVTFFERCHFRQLANYMGRFDRVLSEAVVTHQSQATTQQEMRCWPGLLRASRSVIAPNGREIYELLSADDLDAEHRALGHCIDTYAGYALRGTCRLLSVRQNGKSVASIEVIKVDGQLQLAQLRGPDNRSVTADSPVGTAVTWFISRIRRQDIRVELNWPNLSPQGTETYISETIVAWIKQHAGRS